jgi:hypothetical protein
LNLVGGCANSAPMPTPTSWVPLHRQVAAMPIDPATLMSKAPHFLVPGTKVEDPHRIFRHATRLGIVDVTVQVIDSDGNVSLERVDIADLLAAIE